MVWTVYILQCADDSLYTGITTDLTRRMNEHETGIKGARYTNGRGPFQLMYQTHCKDRAEASKLEISIKALSRAKKLTLISQPTNVHLQIDD
jgi:putative endonuclease